MSRYALPAAAALLQDWLNPVTFTLGLLAAAAVGGAAGWMLHQARLRNRLQAHEAWESEMARAASCARDRAFAEREQAQERLVGLQQEHDRCQTRLDALVKKLRDREATIDVLKGELSGAMEANEDSGRRARALHERVQQLEGTIDERNQQDGAPAWLDGGPDAGTDDLTAIRGLGPVLEQRLNQLGIYRYGQLAQMTAANARWLATRLQVVPGRILRDRWADQAREMHRLKHDRTA